MTAGTLIFCVPSAPKAFVSLGLSQKLFSMRIWTRSSGKESQESNYATPWIRSGIKIPGPAQYREIKGRKPPLLQTFESERSDEAYPLADSHHTTRIPPC